MTGLATGSARVSLAFDRGRAVITLDGPTTRNAIDSLSAQQMIDCCERIDADPSVGVVVVRGANQTFCSGAVRGALSDLSSAPPHEAYEGLGVLYEAFTRLGAVRVPTVSCVQGAAVGAGLNLALATDLMVCTPDAKLVSGFAPLGIHPGGGHFWLLSTAGGPRTAAAMGIFGASLSGSEAAARGLAWTAVPIDDIDASLHELTAHLAADPQLALALKATLTRTVRSGDGWRTSVEVERARQMWSLSRPKPV